MMGGRCVPSLIVISTAINQLETNVLLITIYCLRLFCCLQGRNVVATQLVVGDTCVPSLIVINTTITS